MFSLAKEILEVKTKGEEWDWEDFEAVMELMDEEADGGGDWDASASAAPKKGL